MFKVFKSPKSLYRTQGWLLGFYMLAIEPSVARLYKLKSTGQAACKQLAPTWAWPPGVPSHMPFTCLETGLGAR